MEINQKYEGETYTDKYDNKSSNKIIRCRVKYKNRIIPKFENTDVSLFKNAEFSEDLKIMAATETTQIPLGFQAPDFYLPDTISGKTFSLSELKGEKATVVMFICNHCPYVIHVREEIIRIAKEFLNKGIKFIAISSNDIMNYPDDAPEKMKQIGLKLKFPFPYLYDETQDIAKAYHAACTPDFNVFDANLKCVYRGQMDDSRPKNDKPVTGKDLRNVLNNILENKPVSNFQIPSIGCNIKWKK